MSELPQGWAWSSLAELSNMIGGKTPSKADPRFWANGTIPWVSPKDMKVFDLRESEDQISDLAVSEGGMSLLAAESILMVTRSGILAHTFPVAIAHEPVTINQDIKAVPPSLGFNTRYLAYNLKAQEQTILTECAKSGTTVASVETERLNNLPIPLAPLPEQKRIADKLDCVLGRVEACRDRLDRLPALLKRFRQSILAAATSGRLTEDWRADDAAQNWPLVSLGTVATGFSYGSAAKSAKAGSVPVLRMGNIQDGCLDWTDLVFTSNKDEIKKYRLEHGDVLFNRTNSPELVGKTAVFKGEREAVYAGYLIRVKCSPKLLPDYLNYCLGSPKGRDYCWQVKSDGVSQSNINAKKLAAFEFMLPPIDEQHEIVRRVETLFAFADRLEARLATARKQAEQLTPTLLAKAFRGELVPQDPNDEPATELLKRLATTRSEAPKVKRGRASKDA